MAGARNERRLLGVGSSAWFGAGPACALRITLSAARRGVSAPQEDGGRFGPPLLTVHATGRHVKGLAHPKRVRLPFPRQREFARQKKAAGVKGMGVWGPGDVGHPLYRFDLQIAITLPGSC